VADLDVTVAYTTTVRPFDAEGLRSLEASSRGLEASSGAIVLVEPYLAGTSAFAVSSALASRPHRLLSLGVQRSELRRYGTPADHAALQGLDAAGIRRAVTRFLGLTERAGGAGSRAGRGGRGGERGSAELPASLGGGGRG
jgi:transketolase